MTFLKDKFNALTGSEKRLVMVGISVLFLIILITVIYQAKTSNGGTTTVKKKDKYIELNLSDEDADKSLELSIKGELEDAERRRLEQQSEQDNEMEELRVLIDQLSVAPKNDDLGDYGDLELNSIPEPPTQIETPKAPPIIIRGGISVEKISVEIQKAKEEKKKERQRKKLINFIPAGTILKATLINGMYAPTMGKGKESPYPALLQTWDLAFLPNNVRKDLAGCFVLGEAFGELSDSRVHIRLSKISCISSDEKWVLQKSIKGFVNGDDGKVGVAGKTVANFGRLTLTVLLSEFLSSAGEAVKAATQVNTYNPLGGVTTTVGGTAGDIALAAAGSGIGESASMLSEFYLDIMKEMSPVIEVNSRREVEIVIEDGAELLTDDFIWEGVINDEKVD